MVNVEVKEGQAPDVTPDITTSIAIIRWVFPIFVGGLSVQILSLAGKTPCLVLQMFHDMMSIYIYITSTLHMYIYSMSCLLNVDPSHFLPYLSPQKPDLGRLK